MKTSSTKIKTDLPKVLLVDDDQASLYTFTAFLESHCYVDTADNGFNTLTQMKTGHYDMIFMDIMMPQMDGLTLYAMVR